MNVLSVDDYEKILNKLEIDVKKCPGYQNCTCNVLIVTQNNIISCLGDDNINPVFKCQSISCNNDIIYCKNHVQYYLKHSVKGFWFCYECWNSDKLQIYYVDNIIQNIGSVKPCTRGYCYCKNLIKSETVPKNLLSTSCIIF